VFRSGYLKALEAESIHIIREAAAEAESPVLLYSVGKDSSVMLRLAEKAFYPGKIPFPFLHVDTGYKFKEMYEFREEVRKTKNIDIRIYSHPKAQDSSYNPFDMGTQKCCSILKTEALLNAIREGGFDLAIGGARREEERSRAKERVFSFRDKFGQWDPKNQRPELWNIYQARHVAGESIRVFPLSNWTELDIWLYIQQEKIPVVPMYFAKERKMIIRGEQLIPVEEGTPLLPGEKAITKMCRFRTLGCHPCTGAISSSADTVDKIVAELMEIKNSERITRVIDHDSDASMEQKKREGYF